MKLASLQMVNRYAEERHALLRMIDVLTYSPDPTKAPCPPKFRITIDGVLLDEAAHAIARPVLLGEVRARIRRIESDLKTLGVGIDGAIQESGPRPEPEVRSCLGRST